MNRRTWLSVLLACVSLLGACGIENDAGPRDIGEADRPALEDTTNQAADPTSGTDRIYLLAPESANESQHLRPAARDVGDSATSRLQSLFGPLTVVEISARLRTAVPDDLELRSTQLQASGTLVVDVSDQLLDLSASSLVDAIAQIVFTATEVSGVRRIELLVDGRIRQWPAGDGQLQDDALTVYDYPGFIESTQPDFPAVPSPDA